MTDRDWQLKRVEAMTYDGWKPFDQRAVDLLGAISKRILADRKARLLPQYVALGFWLRPAATSRLKERLVEDQSRFVIAPRGVALHLPPTNVDTLFVYSWAISVLAGNCNVVRLPTSMSSDTQWLVNLVTGVIEELGQANRHLFLQYPVGSPFETALSCLADLRMIWGGDAKVLQASAVPIRPDGLSIGFPDRRSFAIIDSAAYRAADAPVRENLAQNFFNDLYWFDQMACGSPRILFWIGEPGELREEFFDRLETLAEDRLFYVPLGLAIAKLRYGMDLLAEDHAVLLEHRSNRLDLVDLKGSHPQLVPSHGGGFLAQRTVNSLEALVTHVDRRTQTLTHFGLNRNCLRALAEQLALRGGYRLVPIGDALKFDPDWDGIPLFSHMTRVITFSA